MIRFHPIIALCIFCLALGACVQTSQTVTGGKLPSDGQPRYEKLPPKEAAAYEAVCRGAFKKLSIRRDVQIEGPVIYRDMTTHQIIGVYHFGFIARFVMNLDAGRKPGITETYFEDYDTKRRTKEVPRSLRSAE